MLQDKVFKLKGKVMHYVWGGYSFIPEWMGEENLQHKPYAEYWMGAHLLAPSVLITGEDEISLRDAINENPGKFIGEKVFQRFAELPYLFKVQDVKEMLSIQVHPSKTEAEKGFAAEEAAGIPTNAPSRNYKDKNHKPEVLVALSEFWLLHGFLEKTKLEKVLRSVPEFQNFIALFQQQGYKGLYRHVMEMPQQQINELLLPLVQRELQRKQNNELTKEQPGWWVVKLFESQNEINDIDRGVFSIYFFNIVKVLPGEAVFQGAGIPHAYLEGQTMELMANSDNVLRGGLTPKHIDIPELIKHTTFEGIVPNIMKGVDLGNGEKNYPCPVPDFGISKIELSAKQALKSTSASLEIITVMEGELQVNNLLLKKGENCAILSGETYRLSTPGNVLAYKAFVP